MKNGTISCETIDVSSGKVTFTHRRHWWLWLWCNCIAHYWQWHFVHDIRWETIAGRRRWCCWKTQWTKREHFRLRFFMNENFIINSPKVHRMIVWMSSSDSLKCCCIHCMIWHCSFIIRIIWYGSSCGWGHGNTVLWSLQQKESKTQRLLEFEFQRNFRWKSVSTTCNFNSIFYYFFTFPNLPRAEPANYVKKMGQSDFYRR